MQDVMRHQDLQDFCHRVFERLGVPPGDAAIAAEVLVAAELRGIASHGVGRLRGFYVRGLEAGVIKARPERRVVSETAVTALIDGDHGLGHPTAAAAMTLALDKACQNGAGFVSVRHSNHFGIAGYYAMMALKRGCIGLTMTNANRWVVPTFGAEPMLGTNPIAIAAPSGNDRPFVLDMATSTVPVGRLEVQARADLPIPIGWATDSQGAEATDPGLVLNSVNAGIGGGLTPLGGGGEAFGGHKGYGLAVAVDIFSALLSAGRSADQIDGHKTAGQPRPGHIGHFFGAWRVDAFRPLAEFQAAMDDLLRRLRGTRKAAGRERVYVAGEKEDEECRRRLRDGIPLPPPVVADLKALGADLGISLQQ